MAIRIIEPVDGEYECPVCGDYTGQRGSVEAHITGKSDDAHQGRVGKDYRYRTPDGTVTLCQEPVNGLDEDEKQSPETDSVSESITDDPDPDDSETEIVAWLLVIGLLVALALSNLGDDDSDQPPVL